MNCARCGTWNDEAGKFCMNCGAPMPEVPASMPRNRAKDRLEPNEGKVIGEERLGFLPALFDFSFSYFITTKVVRLLYGLGIASSGLLALLLIIIGFSQEAWIGIIALVFSPAIFLFLTILDRLYWELFVVLFRIAEHTAEIARQGRQRPP